MKLHYYPDTDSLYIELAPAPAAETHELSPGINLDLDDRGAIVGFDIDHASRKMDLSRLASVELPIGSHRAA